MKKFKTVLSVVAAVAMFAGTQFAKADAGYQDLSITNKVLASRAETVTATNTIANQDRASLQLNVAGDAAGTGLITVVLARSLDGTNFETLRPIVWSVPLAGAGTQVTAITNLDVAQIGPVKYLKVQYVTNADGTANATNCSLWIGKKTIKLSP